MSQKILCLHGFTQNGPLFARKVSAVRKTLQKAGFETVFLTAPVKLEIADLPFEPTNVASLGGSDDSMRSWWPNSDSNPNHYKLDQAFEAIKQSIIEDGPYVGVLGFSQGAALAGVLCQHIHKLHETQPVLKFGIFYSGFRIMRPEHQHFYNELISVPTLHILGSLDTVVSEERSMALYNSCSDNTRTLLHHPGGHFVPNSKDFVTRVVEMVVSSTSSSPPATEPDVVNEKISETSQPSDDWSAFDTIGRA
ncbi:Fsh3p [Sugiyamaella lignohabitans]|uniref:Fsh3p n=1 Tax=Sugiyamaella lignohabitans TaxID=796027 RepID=A0A167EAB9_9ASCO|nr:Fsh3p [Sugiyamaella lignohabitans]ANB13832.1 Fsh3p [Sugiyamaella lignohabitans]